MYYVKIRMYYISYMGHGFMKVIMPGYIMLQIYNKITENEQQNLSFFTRNQCNPAFFNNNAGPPDGGLEPAP